MLIRSLQTTLPLLGPTRGGWAIEFKRSLAPRLEKGFKIACDDLKPEHMFVCYPGQENFPMAGGVRAAPIDDIVAELAKLA